MKKIIISGFLILALIISFAPCTSENSYAASSYKFVISPASYMYDGKSHSPKVTVYKVSTGKVLYTKYYSISGVTTAKNCSTYKVTVKGRNGYTGSQTKSWKIYLGTPSRPSVSVKGKKATLSTTFKYCDTGYIYLYKKTKSGTWQLQNEDKYVKKYTKFSGKKTVTYTLSKGTYKVNARAYGGGATTYNESGSFMID